MRITSKGQVTIPYEIRIETGLLPETEVEFEVREAEVIIKKAESANSTRLEPYVKKMRGQADITMSTDEIMELTRGGDS